MSHWVGRATYEDGTEIEKDFPYTEEEIYVRECAKQYEIESWLIRLHAKRRKEEDK